MRQPVASVLALAAAALAEPGLPAAARARLKRIVTEAEWLADLIRQHLPAIQAAPECTGHADLVQVSNDSVAAERLTCATQINVGWRGHPVLVPLDRVDLRRVIANLLSNATRAAGPSGTVTVGIERRDGQALLVVEDDGPGFGQIQPGHGLGLPVVARCVVACGGGMECRAGALGGTRVSVWLPLMNEGVQADAS